MNEQDYSQHPCEEDLPNGDRCGKPSTNALNLECYGQCAGGDCDGYVYACDEHRIEDSEAEER